LKKTAFGAKPVLSIGAPAGTSQGTSGWNLVRGRSMSFEQRCALAGFPWRGMKG